MCRIYYICLNKEIMDKEQSIIDIIGKNHKYCCAFNTTVDIRKEYKEVGDTIDGIYSYKGKVYCIDQLLGLDIPFDTLSEKIQAQILDIITKKDYVISKSM